MHTQALTFTVNKPFGNLYRKKCVLIAVENDEGEILIGAKPYMYPPTIARLLGGGVDENEDTKLAAVRELQEELGITVTAEDLKPLVSFSINVKDQEGNAYHNGTDVYYANIQGQAFQAGDDVKQIIALTPDELYKLGTSYNELPETLWYSGPEGMYSWADYAKMYGPIHQAVAEEVRKFSLARA